MKLHLLRILDWYIIRKFLTTFFFAIIMILAICVVFDFAEKVDDFMYSGATTHQIVFDYYANFIPYFGNLFAPLFIFISVIFFTYKLTTHSETIALFASGMSFWRLLLPYMLTAALLFALSFWGANFIIPKANATRLKFENTYVRAQHYLATNNVHKQMRPGLFVYIENYDPSNKIAYRFSLERYEQRKLKSKLIADYAQWDSIAQKWHLNQFFIRHLRPDHDSLVRGNNADTSCFLRPEDLTLTELNAQTLDRHELKLYIENQRLQGSTNINSSLVELYSRTSVPFSIFILTIIGLAVSTRKQRSGMGIQISIGLILSFSYILFQRFSNMFAINGSLSPLLAAWLPNIIYAAIALVMMRLATK